MLHKNLKSTNSNFAQRMEELDCTSAAMMKIEKTPYSQPVHRSPYRAEWAEQEVLRKITDQLKSCDIISDSESEYSSPVLLVKKKNGEQRMVVDYRRVNIQTVKDRFSLPVTDDILGRLAGNELFCTLNVAYDYFGILLDEIYAQKAAFTNPDGLFRAYTIVLWIGERSSSLPTKCNACVWSIRM